MDRRLPIVLIEDGLDENDWAGFARMTAALGAGSRSLATTLRHQSKFIERGVKERPPMRR